MHPWIVVTIGKHIVAQYALAGGDKGIGVEEAAPFGGVISALQVIQICLLVEDISPVAEGVIPAYIIGSFGTSDDIAPGIVGVAADQAADIVQNGDHIALNIGDIVVGTAPVGYSQRRAVGAVSEVQPVVLIMLAVVVNHGQLAEPATVVNVAVSIVAVGSLGTHTICVNC